MPPLAAERRGAGPVVVLVHGFTQRASSMAPLGERLAATRRVVAVELPGHGGSTEVSADLDEAAALVVEAAGGEPFDVVGYSLGGRVALHVACAAPEGLGATAVISASPGLADAEARRARLDRDVALADALEADGDVAAFLDRWLKNPLFATLPSDRADLEGRRANTAKGLADSLRRCSLGAQRDLLPELAGIERPLLAVCGHRDDPYVRLALAMASTSPRAGVAVVPGAGHAAHLERPDVTAKLLDAFLSR